jgi:hypothetical protein
MSGPAVASDVATPEWALAPDERLGAERWWQAGRAVQPGRPQVLDFARSVA